MESKSVDWFLYDIGLRHERVKKEPNQNSFIGFFFTLVKVQIRNKQIPTNLTKSHYQWVIATPL